MSAVTHKPKCYIYVCAGCNLLDMSERSDKLTCSGACRVKAHRSGYLKRLWELTRPLEIHPAGTLQAQAIERLRPDLFEQIHSGKLTIEDAQPEVCKAFWQVLRQQVEARP